MKIYTLLFIIGLSFNSSDLDLGVPHIQAICEVEFKSGEKEEGIISFGGGGYNFRYTPHGFYFKTKTSSYMKLLSLDFQSLNLERKNTEVFYLENQTKSYSRGNLTESGDSLLTRQFEEKFKIRKEFTAYKSLPIHLHVGWDTTLEQKIINVDSVASFKLMSRPAQKWLDLISQARVKLSKVEDTYTDYVEPAWYHEIRKDKELRNELMKYFPFPR